MFFNTTTRFIKLIHSTLRMHCAPITTEVLHTKNLLVSILGMTENSADKFITTHNINRVGTPQMKAAIKFLKNRKYKVKEVVCHPQLLLQSRQRSWENYYTYFKECGCEDVPLTYLLQFRKIRFTPISELKKKGILPPNIVVVDNLMSYLDAPLPEEDIADLRSDAMLLTDVHRTVVNRYLIRRLGADADQILEIGRVHNTVYNKSLQRLSENLNIALHVGFTPAKILRNPYVLKVNPQHTLDVLEKIPNFLDCNMRTMMRYSPKLIGQPVEQFEKMYAVLQEHRVPDDAIRKHFEIFTLHPATVDERLRDVKSTPETRVLMAHPQLLRLIINYWRTKDRIQFLHQLQVRCTSMMVIGLDPSLFDDYVKRGQDMNPRRETTEFIKKLIKCTEKDMDFNLRRHPYYMYVPFLDIEDTYFYLKRQRFTDQHIIRAMSILLYPKNKIMEVLQNIKEEHCLSTRKPRVNKARILNLALYYLEQKHHFNGNGVWRLNPEYREENPAENE